MESGVVGYYRRLKTVSGIPGASARLCSPWLKEEMIKTRTCGFKLLALTDAEVPSGDDFNHKVGSFPGSQLYTPRSQLPRVSELFAQGPENEGIYCLL